MEKLKEIVLQSDCSDPILVRAYLRQSGHDYTTLLAEHGVHAKPYNGKVSFVYDQISARNDDPIARQCRGLILAESDLALVAYPFDRFFNHGQLEASEINYSSAVFEEKLDGSLIIVYYHAGRWQCATRSMCEAHGQINNTNETFAQLVERYTGGLDDYMVARWADPNCTYMFELTGPDNTVVCQYSEPKLTLLGVRNITTLQEQLPDPVLFNVAATYPVTDIETLILTIRDWDPIAHEGMIVKDKNFNRIKVKSPRYLAMAHASESLAKSWRSVVALVQLGAVDDMLPHMTDLVKSRVTKVIESYAALLVYLHAAYDSMPVTDDMRVFAEGTKLCKWSAPLFALKRNKTESLEAYVAAASPDAVLEHLTWIGFKP